MVAVATLTFKQLITPTPVASLVTSNPQVSPVKRMFDLVRLAAKAIATAGVAPNILATN